MNENRCSSTGARCRPRASAIPRTRSHQDPNNAAPVEPEPVAYTGLPFAITVSLLSGEGKELGGLRQTDSLRQLLEHVAHSFEMKPGAVKLIFGHRALSGKEMNDSLESLGIREGADLLLLRFGEMSVELGMRIMVSCAGTREVNGTYVCVHAEESAAMGHGHFRFQREDGDASISWYKSSQAGAFDRWPAGWYFETRYTYHGIYFMRSEKHDCLPLDDWEPYTAESWSKPGQEPMPILEEL